MARPKSKVVPIRVEPDLYERFQQACEENGIKGSDVLRHYMREYARPTPEGVEQAFTTMPAAVDRGLDPTDPENKGLVDFAGMFYREVLKPEHKRLMAGEVEEGQEFGSLEPKRYQEVMNELVRVIDRDWVYLTPKARSYCLLMQELTKRLALAKGAS